MRLLAALLLVVVLTACDDDEPAPATTTPTSKGACPDSYYEDAYSSSDALLLLLATDRVAEVRVTGIGTSGTAATADAEVTSVDWSRPGARDLPDQLAFGIIGCQVGFEWQAGHTYLVNLLWDPYDESWQVVGHQGMLLYDGGVIGDLDRPSPNGAWGDQYDGQDAAAYVAGLEEARASYRLLLDEAWQVPDPGRRTQQIYKSVHDPQQRVDPGAHRAQAKLAAQLPGHRITWRGRVLRQHLENSAIGDVTLGEALARSTWGEQFAGGAEVHRARLDDREVWVLRCPNFLRSNQTLVLAVAPDGWSMHLRVPQA